MKMYKNNNEICERKCDISNYGIFNRTILNIAWIKKRWVNSPDCGDRRLRWNRKLFDEVAFTLPVNSQPLSIMWRVGLARAPYEKGGLSTLHLPILTATEEPRGLLHATLFLKGCYTYTTTHVYRQIDYGVLRFVEMRYIWNLIRKRVFVQNEKYWHAAYVVQRINVYTSAASYREIQNVAYIHVHTYIYVHIYAVATLLPRNVKSFRTY